MYESTFEMGLQLILNLVVKQFTVVSVNPGLFLLGSVLNAVIPEFSSIRLILDVSHAKMTASIANDLN